MQKLPGWYLWTLYRKAGLLDSGGASFGSEEPTPGTEPSNLGTLARIGDGPLLAL